ncbi:baseplate multidomain protein megatron [Methylobacterium sp. NFXW15]|uniref:baseplate multidomain protein megatron n=1 Tax=Methylobacterium sp. NFXW15 TaxID=2819512 RepID=UPI003CEA664B
MASVVLSIAGNALGSLLGGPIGAQIGGAIGTFAGSRLDQALFGSKPKPHFNVGARLGSLYVTASTEGAVIARVYARARVGGQVIWATKIKETQTTEKVKTKGGKGAPTPKVYNVTYAYSVTFAVALCEGEITSIGPVYADGKPIRLADYAHRLYTGSETQNPDPRIEAVEGQGNAPAYRGLAYLVFDDMPLAAFGNRLPVITVEVIRRPPSASGQAALEDLIPAVTLIPAMGEYVYATVPVTSSSMGQIAAQNGVSGGVDFDKALDQLQAEAPACKAVSLVVAWHGTDLRVGTCRIVPKVENATKAASLAWRAGGLTRATAPLVSRDAAGTPYLGGAPADGSVVAAIKSLKARGFAVTLYPFVMMDIPAGNGLPDPYGGAEQAAFPWRGRITCHPAPGLPGSPDKSAAVASDVAAFFGTVTPGDLAYDGATVTCAKAAEWSFRRFVLSCAKLAAAAGGVEAFLIGSELIGLTTLRSDAATYPAVAQLRSLAADARAILGPSVAITYGADWTEYASHRPADGSGDVHFHLDPLWADANITMIGIDNYMPVADWRDGFAHLDARAGHRSIYDRDYLAANIRGGELYDWYYPTKADRDAQRRVPIADTAYGEDWVFRLKDLAGWWGNAHHDRPGGVRSAAATAWVPGSKPIWFTEIGCPCIDKGANQPNVFVDPKSSESLPPYYSNGRQDLSMQRAFLATALEWWADPANNPVGADGGRMVVPSRIFVWTWDARPYPEFPRQSDVWSDAGNYALGHWINGRLGLAPLRDVVAELCGEVGVPLDVSGLDGVVQGYTVAEVQSPRDAIGPLRQAYFFDGAESQGRIVFRSLASAAVAHFTEGDLVAAGKGQGSSQGPAKDFTLTRTEETALPGVVALTYLDPARNYQSGSVEARRLGGRSAAVSRVNLPLVIEERAARGIAQAILYQGVIEREQATCVLPPSALALDPLDVVTLSLAGTAADYRLGRVGTEAGRPVTAIRSDAAIYVYRDGSATTRPPSALAAVGVGLWQAMDLPLLRPDAIPHALTYAGYTRPWSPIAVERSRAGGAFEADATIGARSIIGALTGPLSSGPVARWDRVNALYVTVPADAELVSLPEIDVLNGGNVAAILTPSGQWEIVQWANAALLAPGRYRLTGLLRGQLGTEPFMGGPTPPGAPFVVLTDALEQSSAPLATRTQPVAYRWGPVGTAPDGGAWSAATVATVGVGLRPYAPAQARLRRAGNGDLTVTWLRRTRVGGDAWEQADVPLNEEGEAYGLDILKDGAVVRTIRTASPSALYAVADQNADFGGPVTRLSIALAQISQTYGRGAALRTTLYV